MTEQVTPPPAPTNIQVGVGAQYIKDFSFESPNAPQIFAQMNVQPQMLMDVNVLTHGMGGNHYESALKIKMESKLGDKTGFIVELTYAGLFALPELPEEQMKLFLLVEAPRLLFPFARSILSTAVREGGFPNVVIQPIDFYALYNSQRGNVGAMLASGAA